MDRVRKIHEMIDKIGKLLLEEFPEHTRASFVIKPTGYAELDVTEWEDKPAEEAKYRYLFRQTRFSGSENWSENTSAGINSFLEQNDSLLRRAE